MSVRTWGERHAQTSVGALGRLVQQPVASLMTVAVIAIALALPLLLDVFLQNARAVTGNWNQAFDISVYLNKKAAAARAPSLAKLLRSRNDVASVRVITAGDALAQFRAASGFGSALDALGDNPLPDTLVVTPGLAASTPESMQALEAAIAAAPDVQTVQVDTDWVGRLLALMDILRRLIWAVGALMSLGVLLVVANTIRLDILNRRAEIEVMKLVGASDGFARRPFLYTGLWYGLAGGILALGLVGTTVGSLGKPVARLAELYGSQFQLRGLGWSVGLTAVGAAVALGWLGAWVAATRHIRAIEPG